MSGPVGAGHGGTPPRARTEWPFVGRREELDTVTGAIGSGRREGAGPRGAVVIAPTGIGKTRLLGEVRSWAERSGLGTATVIATEAASRTPYGTVLHLLPAGTGDPTDQTSWHASFAAALRPESGRTVLLVDDAHHLDRGTAALVLQLVLEGTVAPVIAVRRGEPVPDPITSLWKDGLALRLDLQPFRSRQMRDLIGRALGGPVSDRTLSRLARVSHGNILYAKELVTAAIDGGSLRQRDGVWVWDERVVLAPRLVDAVWARLRVLTDDQRRAMALIALGEPLPLPVAEALVADNSLTELESAGLIRTRGAAEQDALGLAQPLYGEVALDRTGRLARRHLVAELAEAFEADPVHAAPGVVRIARWRLEAGQHVSPETLIQAAARANLAFDHQLAERLARAALAAIDAGPEQAGPERSHVVLDLAAALVGCNRVDEADTLLVQVEDDILGSAQPGLVDAYLDARFRASYLGLGRAAEVRRLLDRAIREVGGPEAPCTLQVAAYRAAILLGEGRAKEAVAVAAPLLAAEHVSELAHLLALESTGEALVDLGLLDRASGIWDRMRRFSPEAGGRLATAAAEADLLTLFAAQLDGRIAEITPAVTALHKQVESSPDVVTRGLASFALGRTLLLAGHPDRARTALLDAVSDFRKVDLGGSLSWALATLSQTASLTGRVGVARRWLDGAREHHARGGTARQDADLVAAEVWLAVAEGDHTAACRRVREGADRYPEFELARANLLHLAYRVGDRSPEVATELRAIAGRVECDFPALLADHVEALRAGDGPTLETVVDQFVARGLELLAAEAANQAAQAHRAAGSTTGARRSAARAAALTAGLGAVHTPALDDPEPLTGLSRREQDVARLAAQGLSNAAIAERLVVSVRTVESHLYQAYAKLGVTGRGGLARFLSGPPDPD